MKGKEQSEDRNEQLQFLADQAQELNLGYEISDEEIENESENYSNAYECPSKIKLCKHDIKSAWINGIGWYREQLKNKSV